MAGPELGEKRQQGQLTLINPTPYLLSILAGYNGYPVHRATIEKYGDKYVRYTPWTRPENFVGNGPFTPKDWKMQRHLSVTKNSNYWDAAKVQLNGEGWPGLELLYNTREDHRKVAVAVQQMWKKELRIKVALANQEWKVFLDTLDELNYKLARLGWLGGHVDPTTFLDSHTSNTGINRTGVSPTRVMMK